MESPRPRPAVVVTNCRTGGTFLCMCLSNHPAIFCERGEILHWESEWLRIIPSGKERLDLVFSQAWYEVSMCKLLSRHALEEEPEGLWNLLQHYPDMRIIFLEREDVVAQALSWEMNMIIRERRGFSHSFSNRDKATYEIDPAKVLGRIGSIRYRLARDREVLKATSVPVMYLAYEDLTDGEEVSEISPYVSAKICGFLGVGSEWPLYTRMRKMHTVPFGEQIANWSEIRSALEMA